MVQPTRDILRASLGLPLALLQIFRFVLTRQLFLLANVGRVLDQSPLQALVLEAEEGARDSGLNDTNFYEVTIASVDQPKLLSRLSEALVSLRC